MQKDTTQEFPEYYLTLFRAVTRAIDALDAQNYGQARQLLIQGQQQAEELVLEKA